MPESHMQLCAPGLRELLLGPGLSGCSPVLCSLFSVFICVPSLDSAHSCLGSHDWDLLPSRDAVLPTNWKSLLLPWYRIYCGDTLQGPTDPEQYCSAPLLPITQPLSDGHVSNQKCLPPAESVCPGRYLWKPGPTPSAGKGATSLGGWVRVRKKREGVTLEQCHPCSPYTPSLHLSPWEQHGGRG